MSARGRPDGLGDLGWATTPWRRRKTRAERVRQRYRTGLGLGSGASEEEGELALSRYIMLECWKKANKAADRDGYGFAECGGGMRADDGTRAALALGFERDKWNQIVKFSKDRTRRARFAYTFRKNKPWIWTCEVDVEPGGFPA